MALEVCAGSWDLRRCLASAALASGRVNVFRLKGRETVAFPSVKGPGELSCQRQHLRLVVKRGIRCRAPKSRFSARTVISGMRAGICRALLTLISKCLSGWLEGFGFPSLVCLGRGAGAFCF